MKFSARQLHDAMVALEGYGIFSELDCDGGVEIPGFGVAKEVEQDREDVVFTVAGRYFRKIGDYDSYEGHQWDNGSYVFEVEPYEKMTTYYRQI